MAETAAEPSTRTFRPCSTCKHYQAKEPLLEKLARKANGYEIPAFGPHRTSWYPLCKKWQGPCSSCRSYDDECGATGTEWEAA